MAKPIFPSRNLYHQRAMPNGRTIINEMCWCGAPRTAHQRTILAAGHGPCPESACARFSFRRYITVRTKGAKHLTSPAV